MSTFVPLLDKEHVEVLSACAREVVECREGGLSLNHTQSFPLECVHRWTAT